MASPRHKYAASSAGPDIDKSGFRSSTTTTTTTRVSSYRGLNSNNGNSNRVYPADTSVMDASGSAGANSRRSGPTHRAEAWTDLGAAAADPYYFRAATNPVRTGASSSGRMTNRDREDMAASLHESQRAALHESDRGGLRDSERSALYESQRGLRASPDKLFFERPRSAMRSLRRSENKNRSVVWEDEQVTQFINEPPVISSAKSSVKELQEIELMLQERLRTAEEVARAIMLAQETVNADTMLRKARAEAEAHSLNQGANGNVEQQALLAERNELRFQVRKAASELRKVEIAAGGTSIDVAKNCQEDMERLARLRSQIELEMDQLRIRAQELEQQLEMTATQRRGCDMQLETMDEQIKERDATIIELNRKIADLEDLLERLRVDSRLTLEEQLMEQKERLERQYEEDRQATIRDLQSRHETEKHRALDDQQADLEQRFNSFLDVQLSDQRAALMMQAATEKAEALQALQSELLHREAANVEALRSELVQEREKTIQTINRKHNAIIERLQQEIVAIQREATTDRERALEEQRKSLQADANNSKKIALDKMEKHMKEQNVTELEKLRDTLMKRHEDELASQLSRQLAQQRKNLQVQHNQDKTHALAELRSELTREKGEAILQQQEALKKKYEAEADSRLKKETELERKRALRETTQEKAAVVNKLQNSMRAEKTEAVLTEQERVKRKFAKEIDDLKADMQEMTKENDRLRQEIHNLQSREQAKRLEQRKNYHALRDRLRELLNAMKLSIVPRVNAPLDKSASSPSAAIGGMSLLIQALHGFPADLSSQPPPSLEAQDAPPITVDVLFNAGIELCRNLSTANQEIEAMKNQAARDHMLLRKQIEEELQEVHAAQLEGARLAASRETKVEWEKQLLALQHDYESQKQQNKKLFENQMKEAQAQAAVRQQFTATHAKEALSKERQELSERLDLERSQLRQESEEYSAAKRDVQLLRAQLTKANVELSDLKRENQSLRLTKTSAPEVSSEEVKRLQKQASVQEMERLRLEKTVANLRMQLNQTGDEAY
eukprot:m.173034 g.173034  ORF g.173034 m.173034 type:complete len:1024 (-) comp17309_c1_seq2:302-3373(-)